MGFREKTTIITGGKRLGVYIAHALAKDGVNLILTYLHSKKIAEQTVKDCEQLGVKVYAVKIDVSQKKQVKKLFRFALQKFGRVDILIHMASTFEKTPFSKLNGKIWKREIGNNLTSVFLCAKETADIMMKQKSGGKIILFGDKKVEKPYAGWFPYLVAKAGVHMLAKVLAKELPKKITVDLIAPTYVHMDEKIPARVRKLYKKILRPEDIVKKVIKIMKA